MSALDFLSNAIWHHEPGTWSLGDTLTLVTEEQTDFWQNTWYEFSRDDGHFYGAPIDGDFTAVCEFSGDYTTLYDQAGLMLRINEHCWIKTGIEYSDDVMNFSVVVTKEHSDWSVIQQPLLTGPQQIRMTRVKDAILVHYRDIEKQWRLMRVAQVPGDTPATLGPMACSPTRAGFRAEFHRFSVTAPVTDALHG